MKESEVLKLPIPESEDFVDIPTWAADAAAKLDKLSINVNSAKTELSGSIDAAKSAAASDLAAAKTELSGSIDAAKSAAASDLAAAKTELNGSIDAAKTDIYYELGMYWTLLCEGGGYSYACTMEEGTTGTKGKTSTYCAETLTRREGLTYPTGYPTSVTKTTEVYDPDDGVVDYTTVVELYAFAVDDTTERATRTLTADASGAWSGVWS